MKGIAIWILIILGIIAAGIYIYLHSSPAMNVHN